MIFARRALQRRLNELRASLGSAAVDGLAARLNRPDEHRLAAAWETAVLHALSKHGSLGHEAPLPSGKRPDVNFAAPDLSFIADITATSDEGLHAKNPYDEFSELIEQAKNRLNLPVGGVDIEVMSREERTVRGTRTILRLPDRRRLRDFVNAEIEPRLRAQIQAGKTVLHFEQDDEKAGIKITIDPSRSPNSTGSYGAYQLPTIKDRNPLYNALEGKAYQLRGATGLTGIIVCDADCSILADLQIGENEIGAETIALEFLRQHSSIGFVLLLSIREESWQRWSRTNPPRRWFHPLLVCQQGLASTETLTKLVSSMLEEMPKPLEMPINAAHLARTPGYGLGHHGSQGMSFDSQISGMRIKVSAREFMELLSGRRASKQANDLHGWLDPESRNTPGQTGNLFAAQLREGRLPRAISIIKTDENDSDDWVEFQFGAADPAITPFR
jgi:hypothetical protein